MKVTLIGTGLMGRPMGERILAAGHHLTVFNRSREKAELLRSSGAEIAASAAAAINSAECVILMLADGAAIREVLFDEDPKPDLGQRTVIQMGSISPTESIGFHQEVVECGGDYLEAPVLGSIPEARAGSLLVMMGASHFLFKRWCTFLQCFGPEPLLVGEVGKAAALKLALNQLIAFLTAGFAMSLGFVQRQGVEIDVFMKIVRQSALYAATFDKKLERMLNRDYANPNFPTKHLLKDVKLFRDEAEAVHLELRTIEGIGGLLALTLDKGFADDDYSAVFETVCPSDTKH
ncbi:MAG: NAD(P)-dependent oxidoreductase [Deltaproteobacteria bacterium]|nr:NAD(P)-dependent oxidoreductase [Deltaproteobacteria bacterium]